MDNTIKVTVRRSAVWLAAQRLATGRNVPERVDVEVDPAELGEVSRTYILQQCDGEYGDISRFTFGPDFKVNLYTGYGHEEILSDADNPTARNIDNAIINAISRIEESRERAEENTARINAEREAQAQAKAEAEAKRAAALETLSKEITAYESKINELRAVIKNQTAKAETMADFIIAVPADARRGALKKMAAEEESATIESIKKRVEDASPYWILKDLDETEEGDDEWRESWTWLRPDCGSRGICPAGVVFGSET